MTRVWTGLAVLTAGAAFQIPSCEGVLTTFNPCGTIFGFCNSRDIDLLFADVPDFNLDPSCTIPFFGVNNPGDAGDCATGARGRIGEGRAFAGRAGDRRTLSARRGRNLSRYTGTTSLSWGS